MVADLFGKLPGKREGSSLSNTARTGERDGADVLSELRFCFPLRRYQQEIIELCNVKLERGEEELHIVAPPGAGKTILGLQIITQFKCNSLVLCPNTTIQSQWKEKLSLFVPPELEGFDMDRIIGTHEDRPLKPITVMTYQVLSTPGREQDYLEQLAQKEWVKELSKNMSLSAGESELRILELFQNNPKAHKKEMSRHVSRLRRRLTEVLDLNEVLHENALELVQALRRQKFGLVVFDECHHLTDYWAAVMTHLVRRLDESVIVGLTGTPPEGKSSSQKNRYINLVGEIDYQVPTPALVKEGGLAPFQDLVYFTEPTEKERNFLTEQHQEFHALAEELVKPLTEVPDKAWAKAHNLKGKTHGSGERGEILARDNSEDGPEMPENSAAEPELPTGITITEARQIGAMVKASYPSQLSLWVLGRVQELSKDGWHGFVEEKPRLALAMGRYLWSLRLPLPKNVELSDMLRQSPFIDDWMLILEDFALNSLKTSADRDDHKLYDRIKKAVRKLGYGLTERGIRKQASPVDRVLAFSRSKPEAVAKILDLEYRNLGDRLRAAVVTDFERTSGTSVKSLKGVLDTESGGAIAAIRTLLDHPVSEYLNPCMVTGSLLLVDQRITEQFVEAAQAYVKNEGHSFKLIVEKSEDDKFDSITAGSGEWETRLYVGLATELFERGISKCLIGTRGIFGEGWDSQSLNTLIDLTTTTSPVSVKQLRGRTIRINTKDPLGGRKVANNWDVVCIAPELEKGLNDYMRFVRKHDGYFGISDDGQIECGVGHVHPSFSDLTPAEVFASISEFNQEMMDRALIRDQAYELWRVGQPYENKKLGCVEISKLRKLALTPPHIRKDLKYKEHCRELRHALNAVWFEYGALGSMLSILTAVCLFQFGFTLTVAVVPFIGAMEFGRRKYVSLYGRLKKEICQPNTQESSVQDIGIAVLSALQERRFLPGHAGRDQVHVTMRSDKSYRIFLDRVEPKHSEYFAKAVEEVMAPITNQPYLIPKYEYSFPRDKNGNDSEGKFFKAYLKGRATPRVASYHAVPKLLARSEKGRQAFESSWNKYVSPGFVVAAETKPELVKRYFGMGPSLAQRMLWE